MIKNLIERFYPRTSTMVMTIIFLIVLSPCLALGSSPKNTIKHILLLHSYHQGHPWEDAVTAGIKDYISGYDSIRITIEYMDTKRSNSQVHYYNLGQLYKNKFQKDIFDVIICVDDNALLFAAEHREAYFSNAPIVFCGLSYNPSDLAKEKKDITGIVQMLDIEKTFEIMLEFHPNTKHIYIINDLTPSGISRRPQIIQAFSSFEQTLQFHILDDLSIEDLRVRLGQLPEQSLVFLHLFNRDRTGRMLTAGEIIRLVRSSCDRPIYTCKKDYLGKGVVGGYLTDGEVHGKASARIALQILSGKNASDINIITEGVNPPIFDYDLLSSLGIQKNKLPAGSRIVNKPFSLYETYKIQIYAIIIVVISLVILTIILAFNLALRKRSERNLQKSEERFRTIFEKSNDAIFIIEKKTWKYINANESALKLTGRSRQELTSLTKEDICLEKKKNRVEKIIKPEISQQLEQAIYIKSDGERRTVSVVSIPLDHNKVIEIVRDVTEEIRLNEMLRQSQKMEAIGTLAGGIAHDFNNILSGIFGYLHLAKSQIENTEKAIQHLEQVDKGGKRAAELVQQILTFSRRTEYQKRNLELFSGVNEALKLLRSSIPTSIEIVKKLNSKSAIYGDSIRIHQVVMNLCTNSYHAMRKTGGTLTVSLEDVDISRPKYLWDKMIIPGEYIKLEVSDTGIGMNSNELEKAFEPYYTTKKHGEGTGLGLALVHAIVDEHDGFLDIHSEPGTGTSFHIYLPRIKRNTDHVSSKTRKMDQYRGHETILIVDDEESIRQSCSTFLTSMGYHTQTCANGKDGLNEIRKNPGKYDLVITDLAMPGMTGDKLADGILKLLPELPIILWTGYGDSMTIAKANELGIRKLVKKPLSNDDLIALIRKVLSTVPPLKR